MVDVIHFNIPLSWLWFVSGSSTIPAILCQSAVLSLLFCVREQCCSCSVMSDSSSKCFPNCFVSDSSQVAVPIPAILCQTAVPSLLFCVRQHCFPYYFVTGCSQVAVPSLLLYVSCFVSGSRPVLAVLCQTVIRSMQCCVRQQPHPCWFVSHSSPLQSLLFLSDSSPVLAVLSLLFCVRHQSHPPVLCQTSVPSLLFCIR